MATPQYLSPFLGFSGCYPLWPSTRDHQGKSPMMVLRVVWSPAGEANLRNIAVNNIGFWYTLVVPIHWFSMSLLLLFVVVIHLSWNNSLWEVNFSYCKLEQASKFICPQNSYISINLLDMNSFLYTQIDLMNFFFSTKLLISCLMVWCD